MTRLLVQKNDRQGATQADSSATEKAGEASIDKRHRSPLKAQGDLPLPALLGSPPSNRWVSDPHSLDLTRGRLRAWHL